MAEDQHPFEEYPEPALVQTSEAPAQADRVVVGVSLDPDLNPGLMFQFLNGTTPTAIVFLRGNQVMLPRVVTDAVATIERLSKDPDAVVALIAKFLEHAGPDFEAAAYSSAMEMVEARNTSAHCPGCSRKIYGAVAARGGCYDCYPELPEGGTPIS